MPYEKPTQNSGKGDVYASGGAFDDGPDGKDDFWKRPGGSLERTLYEWSLDKLSIFLTLTGLQPNKEQQRRPAIYLVVWHDGWRSTNIAIPVELWRVMVKRNHHRDPRVLRALSQNPVDPTVAYWQWVEQNPDLNKLYGTNPTLVLDRLSLLALIPGKAPAPVRQPGGEQVESSGQSGGTQNTHQQASHQPPETPDNNINEHHNSGEKGDGDGDHPGPSRNIKCAQCGVNPRVEPKLYCQDCLEQQEAVKSPVQEKDNTELNEALKEATIFGDLHALLKAEELIEQGATLEFSFIIEKLSAFIDPKPEMSIWSTLTSMFFQIMGYEPVKKRHRVKTIEPWVKLWIKSNFIDIESEKWNELILAGLKEELQDTQENESHAFSYVLIKWLSKEFSKTYLNDEFTNALKERKYWVADFFQKIGAEANQTYVNTELAKAVANNDVDRVINLMELTKTEYEPAMNLLLENLRTFDEYSLLKKLIKRAQPDVLAAGLNHAFSTDNHKAIGAMIKLGGDAITSLITVELMQSSTYSYSAYIKKLEDGASLSPGIADTGLQHAISKGDDSIAKKWINLGASPDADQLTKGLEVATGQGNLLSARAWVELGAKPRQEIINKGLKVAAETGDFDSAMKWVGLGAKLSQEIIDKGVDGAIIRDKLETAFKWKALKPSPEQSQ
ncbi:hypothetical protein [Endozoicomonas euniceicola]|uniref:Uncharacterized protein n=1 Tax=Endozoicomonas euniceicola TaxID=1234143 RepID=A0ABY6GYG2_9GAMM|nr:hypothetical protein [Endozoicomonas euniceicola]UYM17612.1 hypothetical protein NX720_06820 [Endozoicomonas euniceicola]